MLTSSSTFDALIALTRLGVGNAAGELPERFDWPAIEAIAEQHGLSGIVLDGIDEQRKSFADIPLPERSQLKLWVGKVIQNYEARYDSYRRAIAKLAGFYGAQGFKMMVLKGYACSLDWPHPEHRPSGDIDIWQFGQQKEADAVLLKEKGVKVDASHHHHTVFYWHDFLVENHYDFINVHHHKSHRELEKILKEQGMDDSYYEVLNGERVYLPSPNLHALFLLKHLMLHFSTGKIKLRQVLDWAFFMKGHSKEVDWSWLLPIYEEYHLRDFFDILNAICVDDLGFDKTVFPDARYDPALKERVMSDIISLDLCEEMPKALFPRIIWKFRRWRANSWKHDLCYKESMWSAFWSGVWSHLLKPSSF